MVHVTANIFIKEGKEDEFLAIAKELVEKTNALDAGCVQYELCQDVNNSGHFVMVEQWESGQALDDHMKAAHFTGLVPKIGPLTSKPDEITILKKLF